MEIGLGSMFYIVETLGILAFAISGMILAKKKEFDIVGIYIIGWTRHWVVERFEMLCRYSATLLDTTFRISINSLGDCLHYGND